MEIPIPYLIYQYYADFLDIIGPDLLMVLGILVALIGLVYCFAGYRLFRVFLAFWGVLLGAGAVFYFSFGYEKIIRLAGSLLGGAVMGFLAWALYWLEVFLTGALMCMLITLLAKTNLMVGLASGLLGGLFCLVFRRVGLIIVTALIGGTMLAWGGTVFFYAMDSARAAYNFAAMSVVNPSLIPNTAMIIGAIAVLVSILFQFRTTRPRNYGYARRDRRTKSRGQARVGTKRKQRDDHNDYGGDYDADYDYYEELEVPDLPPQPPVTPSAQPSRPSAGPDAGRPQQKTAAGSASKQPAQPPQPPAKQPTQPKQPLKPDPDGAAKAAQPIAKRPGRKGGDII